MKRDNIEVNDRQLACARIQSKEGQDYLNGNYLVLLNIGVFPSNTILTNCTWKIN